MIFEAVVFGTVVFGAVILVNVVFGTVAAFGLLLCLLLGCAIAEIRE